MRIAAASLTSVSTPRTAIMERSAENAGSEIGDTLFPGETKDWIVQLSKKWRSRGLDNQFSLQALNIFCTITEQNPNEVLGASTNTCPNTRRLEFLTWNDIAQIVNHINDDTVSFCRHTVLRLRSGFESCALFRNCLTISSWKSTAVSFTWFTEMSEKLVMSASGIDLSHHPRSLPCRVKLLL